MASFGDLSSAAGLGQLNNHLKTRSYIEGYSFSDADRATFAQLGGLPEAGSFPYAFRWGLHIAALVGVRGARFSGAAAAPVAAAPAAGKKNAGKPAQKAAKEEKKGDDFGDDLFGDDDAEEATPKQSLAEKAAALKAAKAVTNKKAERSQILFEVKPADTEVDLNALFRTITAQTIEGLTWGEGYELKPVAFGIHKLVMSCVIIDDLVLTDDIFEPIEAMEDFVQSVDMLTMNKV